MKKITITPQYDPAGEKTGETGYDLAKDTNEKAKHEHDGTIQTVKKNGDFGETILNTAGDLKAAIIGKGLEKIVEGSVAHDILRHSSIPILFIPVKVMK